METKSALTFTEQDALDRLESMTDAQLDELDFGVIGLDTQMRVCRYNLYESQLTGFSPQRVIGQSMFSNVAPCMNTPFIADQFRFALNQGASLDKQQDFVIRLDKLVGPVTLRLLSAPEFAIQYLLVNHRPDKLHGPHLIGDFGGVS